jgi:hypothetical protein
MTMLQSAGSSRNPGQGAADVGPVDPYFTIAETESVGMAFSFSETMHPSHVLLAVFENGTARARFSSRLLETERREPGPLGRCWKRHGTSQVLVAADGSRNFAAGSDSSLTADEVSLPEAIRRSRQTRFFFGKRFVVHGSRNFAAGSDSSFTVNEISLPEAIRRPR